MHTEAQFLQAIREDPADNTARLQYADWLDEQGDPLGEFIRVQVKLARLRPFDQEFKQLKSREQELLSEHREAWGRRALASLPPASGVGLNPSWLTFSRGIADVTALSTAELAELRSLHESLAAHSDAFDDPTSQRRIIVAVNGLVSDGVPPQPLDKLNILTLRTLIASNRIHQTRWEWPPGLSPIPLCVELGRRLCRYTPEHIQDHQERTRLLIELLDSSRTRQSSGLAVEWPNDDTILDAANFDRHAINVAQTLLAYGVNVNGRQWGHTLLDHVQHCAQASSFHREFVSVLREAGAKTGRELDRAGRRSKGDGSRER